MWLFTKIGFTSVVAHRDDPETMLMRFRCQEDAESFREAIAIVTCGTGRENPQVLRTPEGDYRYRFEVRRATWDRLSGYLANLVDYPNFKDSVHLVALQDGTVDTEIEKGRARTYLDVWFDLRELQAVDDGPPVLDGGIYDPVVTRQAIEGRTDGDDTTLDDYFGEEGR